MTDYPWSRMAAERRVWLSCAWMAGWVIVGLLGLSAWPQAPSGVMSLDLAGKSFEVLYEGHEIKNLWQPDEIHYISGSPASVTAHLEGTTAVLTAPFLTYRAQAGLFSATSGVMISDGTLTVQARQGEFDVAKREARFRGDVQWQLLQKGGRVSRGDRNEFMTLRFGERGVEYIHLGSAPGRPGRMFLSPERGMMERFRSGEQQPGPLPEPPRIERALAPLDR